MMIDRGGLARAALQQRFILNLDANTHGRTTR
jgi:hypothetical protein